MTNASALIYLIKIVLILIFKVEISTKKYKYIIILCKHIKNNENESIFIN